MQMWGGMLPRGSQSGEFHPLLPAHHGSHGHFGHFRLQRRKADRVAAVVEEEVLQEVMEAMEVETRHRVLRATQIPDHLTDLKLWALCVLRHRPDTVEEHVQEYVRGSEK